MSQLFLGIDYIELILSYTLNKIKENDKIEIEKMLKSHLNPELGEEIMGSIVDHWLQEGRKEEEIIIAKNLIKAGLKTDLIIASTGLKKEEIEKLQQIV